MYQDEIKGLYNPNQLKDIGFRSKVFENEQKLLMKLRRDLFDTLLTLYAIDNAEPFNKSLKRVSIKEFLEAVQRNYGDDQFTFILKNRLEAAVALHLGREVYYEEDFFNSPTSSDPDMTYQMIANAIFEATTKIPFSKDKYKTNLDGSRNSTEVILSDLTEDLSALEFCEGVICNDVRNMLSRNKKVDDDNDIPAYLKKHYKTSPRQISLFITNADRIHAIHEEVSRYFNKIQKKLKRKTKRKENLEAFAKFFVKKDDKTAQTSETEDMGK